MGTFWSLKLLPMVPDIIRTGARMTTPTLQELDGDVAALRVRIGLLRGLPQEAAHCSGCICSPPLSLGLTSSGPEVGCQEFG